MAATAESRLAALQERITADIRDLSARLGREFAIDALPQEAEVTEHGAECLALLRQITAGIGEYRKLLHLQDQRRLSAFMKVLNQGGETSDELRRWWANRY